MFLNRGFLSTGGTLKLHSCSALRRIPLHRVFPPKSRHISSPAENTRQNRENVSATWSLWFAGALGVSVVTWTVWREYQPFRHSVLAAVRCSRVAGEVTMLVLYFMTDFNQLLQALLCSGRSTTRLHLQNRMNQMRCVWRRTPNAISAVRRGC
jgi:hypothetical protein